MKFCEDRLKEVLNSTILGQEASISLLCGIVSSNLSEIESECKFFATQIVAPIGGGKSLFLNGLQNYFGNNAKYLDCLHLPENDICESISKLGELFRTWESNNHLNVILLDNLDFCSPPKTFSKYTLFQHRITSFIISAIDNMRCLPIASSVNIFLVATATSSQFSIQSITLCPDLMQPNRLGQALLLSNPDKLQRQSIILKILSIPMLIITGDDVTTIKAIIKSNQNKFTSSALQQPECDKIILNATNHDCSINRISSDLASRTQGFSVSDLLKLLRSQLITPSPIPITTTTTTTTTTSSTYLSVPSLYYAASSTLPSSLSSLPPVLKAHFKHLEFENDNDDGSSDIDRPVGVDAELRHLTTTILGPNSLSLSLSHLSTTTTASSSTCSLPYPDPYRRLGVKSCSGILIYGPSGCGKTSLALAVARACSSHYRFMSVSCAELVHKVVGESEKRISEIFSAARLLAPCILLLDNLETVFGAQYNNNDDTSAEDIDANNHTNEPNESPVTPSRNYPIRTALASNHPGSGGDVPYRPSARRRVRTSHAALDRLLSALLVEVDGIFSSGTTTTTTGDRNPLLRPSGGGRPSSPPPPVPVSGSSVVVIATCQSRDLLDRALIRPGRLEEHIELKLPTYEQRILILTQQIQRVQRKCIPISPTASATAATTDASATTTEAATDDGNQNTIESDAMPTNESSTTALSLKLQLPLLIESLAMKSEGKTPVALRQLVQEAAMAALRSLKLSGSPPATDTAEANSGLGSRRSSKEIMEKLFLLFINALQIQNR